MKKQFVILIDVILLAGTIGAVIALFWFGLDKGDVSLSPDLSLDRSSLLFQFRDVERILVSADVSFESSSIRSYEVQEGQIISLEPGVHYLGLESESSVEIRKIETDGKVNFVLVEFSDGSYGLANSGEDLNVKVQRGDMEQNILLEGGNNA